MVPYPNMTFPIDWVAYDVQNSAVVFQVQNACAHFSFCQSQKAKTQTAKLTCERSPCAAVPRRQADAVPVSQLDAPRLERKAGALDERRNSLQPRAWYACRAYAF